MLVQTCAAAHCQAISKCCWSITCSCWLKDEKFCAAPCEQNFDTRRECCCEAAQQCRSAVVNRTAKAISSDAYVTNCVIMPNNPVDNSEHAYSIFLRQYWPVLLEQRLINIIGWRVVQPRWQHSDSIFSHHCSYVSESSSEIHEQKCFRDNLTLPKSTHKCWLGRDLNSHLQDIDLPLYLLSYQFNRIWRPVFIQLQYTRYCRDNLTPIHERMSNVSTLFQNHPQKRMNSNVFMIICSCISKDDETLGILSWISVRLSREYLVHFSRMKTRLQSLWTR